LVLKYGPALDVADPFNPESLFHVLYVDMYSADFRLAVFVVGHDGDRNLGKGTPELLELRVAVLVVVHRPTGKPYASGSCGS
jgi:hypothetical protein